MLHSLKLLTTEQTDPCHNLALEEVLLHAVKPGECILYLWQNQNTVVIGRNQHAASECRIQALEADGGHLVRRLSGGGAVYHDLGNLNFTFLVTHGDYDVDKQTETILRAVQQLSIQAERTGRNDLTIDGKKFSGHAYYRTGNQCYHHGTLMLSVDVTPLEQYLQVSPLKLQAKGVKSVRARVTNLVEHRPNLTIPQLKAALRDAFGQVYGLPVAELPEESLDQKALQSSQKKFSDPAWIYGDSRPLPYSREGRFDWGTLRLDYALDRGTVVQAALWSDGLDADYLSQVPALLQGCPLDAAALQARLLGQPGSTPEVAAGIVTLLIDK